MAETMLGPLTTNPGEQGGLGGEKVNTVVPLTINVPDPLGLNKVKKG